MELNITKGNGVVEKYNVTMTPVDADQCSTYQPIETKTLSCSTNKTQETVVNITSLNPGTLYNISVTSVSNGQHSLPHYLQNATGTSCILLIKLLFWNKKDDNITNTTIRLVLFYGV